MMPVIPWRLAWAMPARNPARRVASSVWGSLSVTQLIASSCSIPVARPVASRTIWPLGGSGVSSAMPAIATAAEFRQALWKFPS